MARIVKRTGGAGRARTTPAAVAKAASTVLPVAKTRVSAKHQVTIAKEPFAAAGLRAGDVLTVRAVGPGRVELTRLDELFAKHRGRVTGGNAAREAVEQMRDEWL